MLHRVLASFLCLLGAVALGTGVASATLWRASDTLEATATGADGTTLLLTEPGVLDLAADEVEVVAGAEGRVVLALGRTDDVEAWVSADPVTRVTGLTDLTTLTTREVTATPSPAATSPAATPAPETAAAPPADPAAAETPAPAADAAEPAEEPAPDPAGSDLWVEEVVGEDGRATLDWAATPGRWSLLVATDGGPATLTLTWPQVVTTPWLVPGVVLGAVLLLAGLGWWTLLLVRARRAPVRRVTTGPLPVVGPAVDPVRAPGTGAPVPAWGAPVPVAPASSPGLSAAPSVAPASPGDPTAAPVPALAPGSGVGVPLTRRALRELEERERREARHRPRTGSQPAVAAPRVDAPSDTPTVVLPPAATVTIK